MENEIVFYDNITIEEMLDEFIDSSKEVAEKCSHYISRWSERGYENTKQRKEFEKKIEELNKYKEQVEELQRQTIETLSIWYKEQEEINDISWDEQIHNWDLGDLKELKSKAKEDLNKTVLTVIEKLDQNSKDLIEAINTAEEWKNWQKGLLNDEIKAQALMLQKSDKMLEEEIAKNAKLQEESEEKLKMLAKSEEREEELNRQLYLERKPLPSLPKKRNILQKLGSRIKTKFQKLQQLVENKKHQAQEFTAWIEVKVN